MGQEPLPNASKKRGFRFSHPSYLTRAVTTQINAFHRDTTTGIDPPCRGCRVARVLRVVVQHEQGFDEVLREKAGGLEPGRERRGGGGGASDAMISAQ